MPKDAAAVGFVMVAQGRSVGYHSRRWKQIGVAPVEGIEEVLSILGAFAE